LIDKLALRVGNEKDEDEADTVGCCSLRVEHIVINDENKVLHYSSINKIQIVFDFLGKDSMRYYNEVKVDPKVWENMKIF
jgi:DNA topoisomerase-1